MEKRIDEKISVIIPVYKVELYLRQCLDSVVNQTYRNLEIIIVDDGSPDRCGEICDEYVARDPRCQVIHKENAGLTKAWTDGLRKATGEWIAFVDSDDWLELDYFEKSIDEVSKYKPDVLQMGCFVEEFPDRSIMQMYFPAPFFYDNDMRKDYLMARVVIGDRINGQKYKPLAFVWAKLYNTSFLRKNEICFDPSIRAGLGCDNLFNLQVFGKAKTVMGCMYGGYHYRRTAESGTLRFGPDRPIAVHYVLKRMHESVDTLTKSKVVSQAIDAYACCEILAMMSTYYFHPDNSKKYREIASDIRQLKQQDYYHRAIFSRKNRFLTWKQKLFNFILRMPFVWPIKFAICFYPSRLHYGKLSKNKLK